MDVTARVTAKGQVTIPKAVRDALTIREGDAVVFRVERNRAILARSARLLELAGTVAVPAGKRGRPWAEVVADTRRSRATRRA